jgi:IS605 OrfB family transposase
MTAPSTSTGIRISATPSPRVCSKCSARWRNTQARIAALHTTVANAQRDGPHRLTTRPVHGHPTIVIEDLRRRRHDQNRRLARHVPGVEMGELRRQVEYKTGWSGVRAYIVNRCYPSSKTCSGCGAVTPNRAGPNAPTPAASAGSRSTATVAPPVTSPHSPQ